MGTQVDCKSYFPEYFSMRNLNEDSNSSSWPLFGGDKTLTSGQFYNGYMPRNIGDACVEYDKDTLKQKMLEHEAVFRNQVYELHRLYRIQRDMMEDIRRKEIHERPMSIEPSSSSSLRGSQMPSGDTRKWHMPNFPLANSGRPGPSMSGADMVSSPLSCTKGSNGQAGPVSGSISKDCEVIECRPSKVRKKLFDLQLPADEYIDTEEGKPFRGSNMSNISNFLPNGDKSVKHEKFFLNGCNGERFGRQWDASPSDSCQKSSVRLADLNEPVPVEDEMLPSSIDCLLNAANHVEGEGFNYSVKPGSQFLASQKRIIQNTDHRNLTGSVDDAVSLKGKGREWLCNMYDSGLKKNNLISMPLSLQQEHLPLPSKPLEVMLNKGSSPILPTDRSMADFWRERTARNMEVPVRIHENPNFNHLESIMTSQAPRQYQYISPSEVTNSWSHSALSWAKPTNSLTEKPSSYQLYPFLNSSTNPSKSTQSSALSHGIVGEKWQSNGCSRLPSGSVDLPVTNGFYHGSSSGSKERLAHYPSIRFGHLDSNGVDNDVQLRSVDRECETVMKGLNYMEAKPRKDMDLNLVHSKCTPNEAVGTQDVEVINEKPRPEGRVPSLPWLRAKPNCRTEAVNISRDAASEASNLFKASPSKFFQANEWSRDFDKMINTKGTTIRSESEKHVKKENGDTNGVRNILGVPIYEKVSTSRKETSSSVSTSVTRHHYRPCEELPSEGKKRVIDINLACDEQTEFEVQALEEHERKVTPARMHIDLNSCISEEAEEEPLGSYFARHTANKKIVVDIDLEAPAPEMDDDLFLGDQHHEKYLQSAEPKPEQESEELDQMAAEAIVSLSLSSHPVQTEEAKSSHKTEDALADSLLWFADVICDSSDTKESKGSKEVKRSDGLLVGNRSSSELDDFEIMTLQLQETKEEDYMPTPFFHEVQNMEEPGANTVPTRGRKPSRRGRQRRDFQRDILPGLASLSRHEVTEDLQTFGGLMKATGQTWSSGLTRRNGTRNGSGRGRRRAVVEKVPTVVASVPSVSCTPLIQQLNSIESGLEDRSLTGWGKTTRRPRRQRCPAGNPPTVALT